MSVGVLDCVVYACLPSPLDTAHDGAWFIREKPQIVKLYDFNFRVYVAVLYMIILQIH